MSGYSNIAMDMAYKKQLAKKRTHRFYFGQFVIEYPYDRHLYGTRKRANG
jgi:hypothetical protein